METQTPAAAPTMVVSAKPKSRKGLIVLLGLVLIGAALYFIMSSKSGLNKGELGVIAPDLGRLSDISPADVAPPAPEPAQNPVAVNDQAPAQDAAVPVAAPVIAPAPVDAALPVGANADGPQLGGLLGDVVPAVAQQDAAAPADQQANQPAEQGGLNPNNLQPLGDVAVQDQNAAAPDAAVNPDAAVQPMLVNPALVPTPNLARNAAKLPNVGAQPAPAPAVAAVPYRAPVANLQVPVINKANNGVLNLSPMKLPGVQAPDAPVVQSEFPLIDLQGQKFDLPLLPAEKIAQDKAAVAAQAQNAQAAQQPVANNNGGGNIYNYYENGGDPYLANKVNDLETQLIQARRASDANSISVSSSAANGSVASNADASKNSAAQNNGSAAKNAPKKVNNVALPNEAFAPASVINIGSDSNAADGQSLNFHGAAVSAVRTSVNGGGVNGVAIRGDTGPEMLLYPVLVSLANGAYLFMKKKK